MFGDRMLSKAVTRVSEEGAKQHELVRNEITKLAELTGQGWDLITSRMFDKVRKVSFGQGMIFGAGLTGLVATVHNKMKKNKIETDEVEEE